MNYQIEPLQSEDWRQVRSIYEESISTGVSTFDTKPPNWERLGFQSLTILSFGRKGWKIYLWLGEFESCLQHLRLRWSR